MSIVSSPASPPMVMVLRRRLVPEKSPKIWNAVAARSRWSSRIDAVDPDLLDLRQFGDDRGIVGPIAGDHDLRGGVQAGDVLPAAVAAATV